MKGNDGSGDVVDRDEWETPQKLFEKLDKQYNFDFDCCATSENKKTLSYSNNFLSIEEPGNFLDLVCWMNPPFSKARKMFEWFFYIVVEGVAIYRCDNMETKLWQEVIFPNCDWVFIPKGRVNYEGMEGDGARFPSALIGVGVERPNYLEGVVLEECEQEDGE